MTEFSMDGKEVVSFSEEHREKLRQAGYTEIESAPTRGVIMGGKFVGAAMANRKAWAEATHEVLVFMRPDEAEAYEGELTWVNEARLRETVYVVAKI